MPEVDYPKITDEKSRETRPRGVLIVAEACVAVTQAPEWAQAVQRDIEGW